MSSEMVVTQGPLNPYSVLDLSNERGLLCGKLLGDLGADVIKIEPPGGDRARRIGPFYQDVSHPEQSLFWFAFNTNKRSIVLDLEKEGGRQVFLKLVTRTDFVIESFPPGYLDSLGVGYPILRGINPRLVLVSITPYGQSGPYRDYKATDLTLMAMGGLMYLAGDPDRPPVRPGVPQAYLHAGTHAAVGALIAHWYRQMTGRGQWVDVSIQECVARALGGALVHWECAGISPTRGGGRDRMGRVIRRQLWPCKDGSVGFRLVTGRYGRGTQSLVDWMAEEGMAGPLAGLDWTQVDLSQIPPEINEEWERWFGQFFRKHTRAELYREAIRRRIFLLPDSTTEELWQDPQLRGRSFWVEVEHPELGRTLTYPGAPFKMSRTPWRISRRAPLVGEHTREVMEELEASNTYVKHQGPRPAEAELPSHPLEGIRVLDFTWALAGPLVTKYLADFGVQVIRVESRSRPDILRVSEPYKDGKPGLNRAGIFALSNSSKYSLGLNLSHPQGIGLVRRLVNISDVVVENFAVGQMKKWGLAFDDLQKIKPDLIMLSTSTQGQTGPHAQHPSWGWNLNALAGFNSVTGWPDRAGVPPAEAYTDYVAPWLGAVAVLAALDYRCRTGQGQYIDLSQFEAGVTFLAEALLDYTANGRVLWRQGNRSQRACPHGVYRCRGEDRWCAVAVTEEQEWSALCVALDWPPWAQDPRFTSRRGRQENEDELERLLEAVTASMSAEELMVLLQRCGVPSGVVQSIPDILDRDPQMKHREAFPRLQQPEMGTVCHRSPPFRLSETPAQLSRAPCLGEHNELLCYELLGISDEELASLVDTGVLE